MIQPQKASVSAKDKKQGEVTHSPMAFSSVCMWGRQRRSRRRLHDSVCVCVQAYVLGWGCWGRQRQRGQRGGGREGRGETEGRAGRGLQSFPGRALSHGSFSSWDSVNRQWLNGDEKGAGAGRTAQREAAPHENCAPVKALFWLVFQAHKQTALLIGSITVTPLVVQHTRFSFSTTVIKRVTYFACIDCCIAVLLLCSCLSDPPSLEYRITKISPGNSCVSSTQWGCWHTSQLVEGSFRS